MTTRVVTGRAGVVRELRAAGPLLAALRAPVTARAPWLTAALALDGARLAGPRPVAVVVDPSGGGGAPRALATLVLRGGPRLTATLLGDGLPVPAGGTPDTGWRTEMGAPLVSLTLSGGGPAALLGRR